MRAIFPKLCLWRRSLWSNLGGIGLEKLYRATLSCLLHKWKEESLYRSDEGPMRGERLWIS